MGLSREQAKALLASMADVFTPKGDAGVITRLYTFSDPGSGLAGKGQCAMVVGSNVHSVWFPISELDSAETLKASKGIATGTTVHVFKYATHAVTVSISFAAAGNFIAPTMTTADGGEMLIWHRYHHTNEAADEAVAQDQRSWDEMSRWHGEDDRFAVVRH